MKLHKLVKRSGLDLIYDSCLHDFEITQISDDSRDLNSQSLFCLTKQSLPWLANWEPKNNSIILSEKNEFVEKLVEKYKKIHIILCESVVQAQGALSSALFDHPSRKMKIIGITGTNGKTSIAQMMYWALKTTGKNVGTIGTLGAKWTGKTGEKEVVTGYTTPRSYQLQNLLSQMWADGVSDVAIEVSSEALDLGRLEGCHFTCSTFINLSQDHLDHHLDMESYYFAKKKLFIMTASQGGHIIINTNDVYGRRLAKELKNEFPSVDIHEIMEIEKYKLRAPVLFNFLNATIAMAAMSPEPLEKKQLIQAIERMPQIPGRFEMLFAKNSKSEIKESNVFVIVDYAHTPDALENLLEATLQLDIKNLICVFGCGGDRDPGKRKLMGRIAQEKSDVVIVCDDNPRTEVAEKIREEILSGITKNLNTVLEIGDRKKAIHEAMRRAVDFSATTAVVVAGKGHEDYQIIGKQRIKFSDVEESQQALEFFVLPE